MKIRITTRFKRNYRKLSPELRREAKAREKLFKQDTHNPRLKTHKLKGRLRGLWSFSITRKHRILFEFISNDIVIFHDIGDHSVY